MEMLQGVWKQHLRPRAVVGYGVKIFLPSPPNYVTRSPGCCYISLLGLCTLRPVGKPPLNSSNLVTLDILYLRIGLCCVSDT